MNKLFLLPIIFWASQNYCGEFEFSSVEPDFSNYQMFETLDKEITKLSCRALVCEPLKNTDLVTKEDRSKLTPPIENTPFETFGEVIFILGTMGLADNCRDKFSFFSDDSKVCSGIN